MKSIMLLFMESRVLTSSDTPATEMNISSTYTIVTVLAFLVLCYLIFALIKPEKF